MRSMRSHGCLIDLMTVYLIKFSLWFLGILGRGLIIGLVMLQAL